MFGHRSLYHDGWRAVCPWPGTSFIESGKTFGTPLTADMLTELDEKGWELYNLSEDFAETNNLAAKEKGRLIAMIGMWYAEAGKYNVLPIDSRGLQRVREERPQIAESRNRYVLYPGTQSIPAGAAPQILNRPFSINTEVEIPPTGSEGVLLSFGGNDGGITLYVQEGKLCFLYNYVAVTYTYVKSKDAIPSGHHFLSVEFAPTGSRTSRRAKVRLVQRRSSLMAKKSDAATSLQLHRIDWHKAVRCSSEPTQVRSVNPEYKAPFSFTGTIKRVIVDISGEHVEDHETAMRVFLAKQ